MRPRDLDELVARLHADGLSSRSIAPLLGVSSVAVCRILQRQHQARVAARQPQAEPGRTAEATDA